MEKKVMVMAIVGNVSIVNVFNKKDWEDEILKLKKDYVEPHNKNFMQALGYYNTLLEILDPSNYMCIIYVKLILLFIDDNKTEFQINSCDLSIHVIDIVDDDIEKHLNCMREIYNLKVNCVKSNDFEFSLN